MFGGGSLWGGADQGGLVSEVGVHEKMASSVKEYAYTEEKNFRYRPTMEDSKHNIILNSIAYCIKDAVANDPSCGIFAVFDGHGGRQVSDHCAERMGDELRKEIAKTPGDLS